MSGEQKDLGTIILDPGHGGKRAVPGSSANNAISASGVKEKVLTLDFAQMLRAALVGQAEQAGERIKVVLTRTQDVNVTGAVRAGAAARHKAAAFLSIHFNGSARKNVRGPETFYRARENGNANLPDDLAFAKAVHAGLVQGLDAAGLQGRDRGVKPDSLSAIGALGVLNDRRLGRLCCSALVEVEFITHQAVDEALIAGPEARANLTRVAAEVAAGIRRHLAEIKAKR